MRSSGVWRFGPFELDPVDRKLLRDGTHVLIQPKAFDLLTILVRKAGELISRKELFEKVWPDAAVEDANLTNNITVLRKVLGPEAIRAVPKYGYRFCMPILAVPGLSSAVSEMFHEGKRKMLERTTESVQTARNSFWLVIAHEPAYAPAWAWLARACRYLEKFGIERDYHREMTEVAFRRAFDLDSELDCAHQFFTTVLVDRGESLSAMSRLLCRIKEHPYDAHSFASLVQVCRFCGLLDASEAAHRRAKELDPGIATSIPHTYFARCDYQSVVKAYSDPAFGGAAYLDLSAWACLGFKERTTLEISKRLGTSALPPVLQALLRSLLHALNGDAFEVKSICLSQELYEDPETALYFARHLAFCDCVVPAVKLLQIASNGGLAVPDMLQRDPWLLSVRSCPEFDVLLNKALAIKQLGQRFIGDAQISQFLLTPKQPTRRRGA